jgi:hypothetical protein
MKINEVTQPSDRALFEAFDRDNSTGFVTEDLVQIYRTHNSDSWDAAQLDDELDRLNQLDDATE